MSYAIVRTDNMAGTFDGSKVVSFRYFDGTEYTAVENGAVLKLDSLIEGEKDVWKAVKPTANDTLGKLILVATPELMADERKQNLDEFVNGAGKNARGYIIQSGCTFSATSEAFNGTPDITTNKYLTVAAAVKLATATAATNARFDVIAVESVGSKTYFVIRAI